MKDLILKFISQEPLQSLQHIHTDEFRVSNNLP